MCNRLDQAAGQSGIPNAFAYGGGAVLPGVGHVSRAGVPTQVAYVIVEAISVVVAALHPVRARTYKCFEHQAVYINGDLSLLVVEPGSLMPFGCVTNQMADAPIFEMLA